MLSKESPTHDDLATLIEQYAKKQKGLPKFSQETTTALYAIGYGFYENGKYGQAVHVFRFLTLADPYSRKYWMGLGASYQMLKEYGRALQCYGCAAQLDPYDPYTHFHAAVCFFSLDRPEEGNDALNSAQAVALKQPAQHKVLLSRLALMQEKQPPTKNSKIRE